MKNIIPKLISLILITISFCSNATDLENQYKAKANKNSSGVNMPTENTKQSLSNQEKEFVISTVNNTIEIITGSNSIDDLSKKLLFDKNYPIVPMSAKAPTREYQFIKQHLLSLTFYRESERSPWEKAMIVFSGKDLKNLRTNFKQEDFEQTLKLEFKGVKENIQIYPNSNQEMKYYTYEYVLYNNSYIKLLINVYDNQFISNTFPKNFFSIVIEKLRN